MLDERLSLAADMYQPCALGADVGTDHALLPCRLLASGVCREMILADVSPKALQNARRQVEARCLTDRARLVCADGLDALTEPCGCVSVMGMGGETIAGILTRGRERLQGAVLVLSAHTDLHLVRRAVQDIGYHIVREELCRAAGRFYVVWRAEEGYAAMTPDELRYGPILMHRRTPLTDDYVRWRIAVLTERLNGLRAASTPDENAIAAIRAEVEGYRKRLEA